MRRAWIRSARFAASEGSGARTQLLVRGQRQLRQALAEEGFNVGTDCGDDQGVRDEGTSVGPENDVPRQEWRVRTAQGLLYDAS